MFEALRGKAPGVLCVFFLLAAVVVVPAGLAFAQAACERSGPFFGCPATVNDVRVTVQCPGTGRSATGAIKSMRATEFAPTQAESLSKSNATARREAERIARDRAFAKCGRAGPGGSSHSVSVEAIEMGACGTEGRFVACTAVARNVVVRARCLNRNRTATGRLASMTATEFAFTIPEAQAKARATASREGERVALDRALARLRC